MKKCLELRKLPKAPKFSSILWKYQSPGSVAQVIFPGRSGQPLDPRHPVVQRNTRGLPQHKTDAFNLKVVPFALLDTQQPSLFPFRRPFVTWDEQVKKAMDAGVMGVQKDHQFNLVWKQTGQLVGNTQIYPEDDGELLRRTRLEARDVDPASPLYRVKVLKAQRRVPMSLFVATSKSKMGSLRCRRKIITSRVKLALNHIVCRGAYLEDPSKDNANCRKVANPTAQENPRLQRTVLKFDPDEAALGRQLVLQGWSYIIQLTAELYRMPYTQLIPLLRDALSTVNTRAIEMENKWLAQALLNQQHQEPQEIDNNVELSEPRPGAPLSTLPAHELVGETETEPRAPYTLIPPSHPPKTQSTFDSAAWRRDLTSQLKLLSQMSTAEQEGSA